MGIHVERFIRLFGRGGQPRQQPAPADEVFIDYGGNPEDYGALVFAHNEQCLPYPEAIQQRVQQQQQPQQQHFHVVNITHVQPRPAPQEPMDVDNDKEAAATAAENPTIDIEKILYDVVNAHLAQQPGAVQDDDEDDDNEDDEDDAVPTTANKTKKAMTKSQRCKAQHARHKEASFHTTTYSVNALYRHVATVFGDEFGILLRDYIDQFAPELGLAAHIVGLFVHDSLARNLLSKMVLNQAFFGCCLRLVLGVYQSTGRFAGLSATFLAFKNAVHEIHPDFR